ncbi:MAG TPA: VOC family protein [Nocardioidaceae bacterium]|nr:VOC family protein [Nocardioidaceae bacterium]
MIVAAHTLVYSTDPTATRAFFKDVLRWPFVSDAASSDLGAGAAPDDPSGWLIFATGPSELGVHPTMPGGREHPHHTVSLVCDDLDATMVELTGRGARFRGAPEDRGYGICVEVEVPGAEDLQIYQPRHETAYGLQRLRD